MLIDTNLLLRTLQPHHSMYPLADGAIEALRAQGHKLYLVPQNLVELWTVATRPVDVNGLGMTPSQAQFEVERLERLFTVMPEIPEIYPEWKRLVIRHQVVGKPAHDARLVAAMQVHGIRPIVSFDRAGFSRYPGILLLHPADILAKP